MKTSYERRVDKGIKFLNKKNPDWFKKIKLPDLAMHSCYNCVLGQLYGEMGKGIGKLRMDTNSVFEMGFNVRHHYRASINQWLMSIDRIGEIWVRRIEELQNAK